jgi:3'-phosphoadenosine 5'-phosphosulfate sulfotransferase (PAPS reductase)/FAD synthetase
MLAPMGASTYTATKSALRSLYFDDPRPWVVGFSGGNDSAMVASLIVEVVAGVPKDKRKKQVVILCTDTRVEIPAIVEMVEGTLARIQRFSQQNDLNIEVNLLKPPPEESFWVNIIGRGYPPPNRSFRRNTANAWRDKRRVSGNSGPDPRSTANWRQVLKRPSQLVGDGLQCPHVH